MNHTMKPFVPILCGIVLLMGLRFFVSPLLSMGAIAGARAIVRDAETHRTAEGAPDVELADALDSGLRRSHSVWIYTNLAFDAAILLLLVLGVLRLVRRPAA